MDPGNGLGHPACVLLRPCPDAAMGLLKVLSPEGAPGYPEDPGGLGLLVVCSALLALGLLPSSSSLTV